MPLVAGCSSSSSMSAGEMKQYILPLVSSLFSFFHDQLHSDWLSPDSPKDVTVDGSTPVRDVTQVHGSTRKQEMYSFILLHVPFNNINDNNNNVPNICKQTDQCSCWLIVRVCARASPKREQEESGRNLARLPPLSLRPAGDQAAGMVGVRSVRPSSLPPQ